MAIQRGKIVVVGIGNVGSAVVNKIADFELASEIVLIDILQNKAKGEALDASHASSSIFSLNMDIHAGDYDDCKDAELIVIAAGPSILPDENRNTKPDRLILAKTNAKVMREVFAEIRKRTQEAKVLVITNPLDVTTYVIATEFDYPQEKVIGTGTMLETLRFHRLLANHYNIDPKNISGYVLGEHGMGAFVAWSTVNVASLGLENADEFFQPQEKLNRKQMSQGVIDAAYDVFNLKGYTNTGIAMAVCRLIKSIQYNERAVVPCSSVMHGEYGIQNVALSLPRMLGRDGIVRSFVPKLTEEEIQAMQKAAQSVRTALDSTGAR